MKPRASIIVPVYNAENTLRRCVESLVLGLADNMEVILSEDCSIDDSWQLCCRLSEEFDNVRCIRNSRNMGVSYTRNAGLREACGEYILFADSYDWASQRYVSKLLKLAEENPDALPTCGHHFIDKVNGGERDYLWDPAATGEITVSAEDFFLLSDRFLLQQLWNKIFRRDLIEEHQIRFDENQSMGEDFQFVLDYLEAARIRKCVVLNEPLYYYIRWNNFSLMSNFGFVDNQPAFDRLEQLARIAGPGSETQRKARTEQSRQNGIYHIVRNPRRSKAEKLEAIERIMGDGKSVRYYREQQRQHIKEQAAAMIGKARHLPTRIRGRLLRERRQKRIAAAVSGVHAEGVTFISQNCIGGVLYHDLGLQFLSPTVNMFIPEPGFVKMVLNLRHYMEQEPVMRWGETYPIGMLGDVEIHFMHYETCQEAQEAWNRRKTRINWEKIFVIGTDRDGFDSAAYGQWKQVPYPKILFTAHPEFSEDAVYYPEYTAIGQIGDLIADRSFYKDGSLLRKLNGSYK